jgi:hypothetical protein
MALAAKDRARRAVEVEEGAEGRSGGRGISRRHARIRTPGHGEGGGGQGKELQARPFHGRT